MEGDPGDRAEGGEVHGARGAHLMTRAGVPERAADQRERAARAEDARDGGDGQGDSQRNIILEF